MLRTGPPHAETVEYRKRAAKGCFVAAAAFLLIGTVAAVWANPFFVRMTPVGFWELPATALLASLSGVFAALAAPGCNPRTPGAGGTVGFLGIACPTCNKVLMLVFGGQALLTWLDPMRPYAAVFGIALMARATQRAWSEVARPLKSFIDATRPGEQSRAP